MKTARASFRDNERGAALAESAIALPVIVIIFATIFAVGSTLFKTQELETAANFVLKNHAQAKLLVDLSDMLNFTVDVAWQEIKFARQHPRDFARIAVVTTDQWLQWSAWLPRIFTKAEVRVFEDYDSALAWIQE